MIFVWTVATGFVTVTFAMLSLNRRLRALEKEAAGRQLTPPLAETVEGPR